MKHETMTRALNFAAASTDVLGLTNCKLAEACAAFLGVIEKDSNFVVRFACGWIRGRIEAWKRDEQCA